MPIDETPVIRIEDVCTSNLDAIPQIPVYRPTEDEFSDFRKFIKRIEKRGAHHMGVCKIIPPSSWTARKNGYDEDMLDELIVPNPILQTTVGNDGIYLQDIKCEKTMTFKEYREYSFTKNVTPSHMDWDDLERKYWSNITYSRPQYGANVAGTITDTSLKVWNIARLPSILDDVLRNQNLYVDGVNTPYLYFGSWQTTFGWHVEDVDLYSINYLHYGMPKYWYVIPPSFARKFEMICRDLYKADFLKCNAFLRHKTIVLSPHFLRRQGIPTRKIVQEENEFMFTFPYGYHAGFNMGLNIAESTNFATKRWIEYGKQALLCHCWPDTVKINMEPFVKMFQPAQYESWRCGRENLPHPLKDYETKFSKLKKVFMAGSKKRKSEESNEILDETKKSKLSEFEAPKKNGPIFFDIFATENYVKKGSRIQRAHPLKSSSIMEDSNSDTKSIKSELSYTSSVVSSVKEVLVGSSKKFDKTSNVKSIPRLLQDHFSSLLIDNKYDFKVEQEFNSLIGSFYPHCAVCSVIWPIIKVNEIITNNQESGLELPSSTEPHIPQLAFSKVTDNKLIVSQVKSPILKCSSCYLTVHARCYGKIEFEKAKKGSDEIKEWKCDKCSKGNSLITCHLCPIRGGAMKRLSNGNNQWAHIVCTLGCQEMYFDDIIRRRPRLPDKSDNWQLQKCYICNHQQQPNAPLCKCTFPNCQSMLHVTCAFFHNILIESETYPHLFFIICDKHPSYYNKQPVTNVLAPIAVGDTVYAQSPTTGYYYLATVLERISKAYCKLVFSSGEYSDDTEFKYIKSHNFIRDGIPLIGTMVTVLWTDNQLTDAEFQGIVPELWKVKFKHLKVVVDLNRDQFYKVTEDIPPHVERFLVEEEKTTYVPKRRESARIANSTPTKFNIAFPDDKPSINVEPVKSPSNSVNQEIVRNVVSTMGKHEKYEQYSSGDEGKSIISDSGRRDLLRRTTDKHDQDFLIEERRSCSRRREPSRILASSSTPVRFDSRFSESSSSVEVPKRRESARIAASIPKRYDMYDQDSPDELDL